MQSTSLTSHALIKPSGSYKTNFCRKCGVPARVHAKLKLRVLACHAARARLQSAQGCGQVIRSTAKPVSSARSLSPQGNSFDAALRCTCAVVIMVRLPAARCATTLSTASSTCRARQKQVTMCASCVTSNFCQLVCLYTGTPHIGSRCSASGYGWAAPQKTSTNYNGTTAQ